MGVGGGRDELGRRLGMEVRAAAMAAAVAAAFSPAARPVGGEASVHGEVQGREAHLMRASVRWRRPVASRRCAAAQASRRGGHGQWRSCPLPLGSADPDEFVQNKREILFCTVC